MVAISIFFLVINILSVLSDDACGPNKPAVFTQYTATITSPGFSTNGNYEEGLECMWIIHSHEGYNIRFTFNEVDLDEMNGCTGDALIITTDDGIAKQICGKNKPNDVIVNNNTVLIHFHSDYLYSGKGFSLTYKFTSRTTVCERNEVQCENRKCVSFPQLCNGVDDCGDDSDEMYCRKDPKEDEFTCGLTPIEPQLNDMLRVVGGFAAVEGSWPWQVDVQVKYIEPSGHICGGTLISSQFVLTAAHCFLSFRQPDKFRLVFGSYNRFETTGHEQVRYIKSYLIYPNFLDKDYAQDPLLMFDIDNDIALIKLSSPVKITERVQPVCLPSKELQLNLGTKCFATGWGTTRGTGNSNVLKQIPLYVTNTTICTGSESEYSGTTGEEYEETKICANSGIHMNGLCSGDSGGPLVYKDDKWYIVGIASHLTSGSIAGPVCAIEGSGETFAKVSAKIDWIQESMRLLNSE
ncbi:Plasma kallikrein-like protein [Leptotrombidium deliense]|uniref:Plasma kallikrein-like protein n=1 Tax=Leptotrombidium deliense TaxID=299467 RepID=A0A443S3G5_9ACAR|nr:Plasma kallikrein-like protein [Leptotrombidium deliense]